MSREKKPRRNRAIKTPKQLRESEKAIKELESQLKLKDFLKPSDIILYKSEIKYIQEEIQKYKESQKCRS